MSIRESQPGNFTPIGGSKLVNKTDLNQADPRLSDDVHEFMEYRNEVSATKASNPKDQVGVKKAPISTVPANVMLEIGLAMLEGGCKYGRHNYRKAGVRASVYYDAVVGRHLFGWWEGQDLDPDSGLSHITKAIAGLMVLRDAMMNNKWTDDRPIKVVNQNWVQDMNEQAKVIIEKYPEPKEPFTQVREDAEHNG